MEKLSRKCKALCVGAVACLVSAVALTPRVGSDPAGLEPLEYVPRGVVGQVQNCTGGESVNCHIGGKRAGL